MDANMLEFERAQRDVTDDERETIVVFKNSKGKLVNHLLRGDWGTDAITKHDAARAAHKRAIDAAAAALKAADDEFAEAARVAAVAELTAAQAVE